MKDYVKDVLIKQETGGRKMDPVERKIVEKIVQKLLNQIKNEGVNDLDSNSFHRSWYNKDLGVKDRK